MCLQENSLIIVFVIIVFVIILFIAKPGCDEGEREHYRTGTNPRRRNPKYRDPIYLNYRDLNRWYPMANGTIYGRPYGENWSILNGYPYYDKAY